ncbi:hypothetical protein SCHPADRAFT_884584 [Schizopora paradoxa]|uniref:Uncharacterized protein n=1 Tax=Schizopora paradoxa TaxID=27342 RepID=A0A0H2STU6_9AGAM|nr:hypothetical protein SCHPADRAFT_884584 [Schizopora paradoxa]
MPVLVIVKTDFAPRNAQRAGQNADRRLVHGKKNPVVMSDYPPAIELDRDEESIIWTRETRNLTELLLRSGSQHARRVPKPVRGGCDAERRSKNENEGLSLFNGNSPPTPNLDRHVRGNKSAGCPSRRRRRVDVVMNDRRPANKAPTLRKRGRQHNMLLVTSNMSQVITKKRHGVVSMYESHGA